MADVTVAGLAGTRRGPGRPVLRADAEVLRCLVEAAVGEFLEAGYAGARVAEVARRAGLSTRTIYRLVATKAELFELAVAQRLDAVLLRLSIGQMGGVGGVEGIRELARVYARLVLSQEGVLTTRLIAAEAGRFPEISRAFTRFAEEVARAFDETLAILDKEAGLGITDIAGAGELLRSLVAGRDREILTGIRPAMDDAAVDDWAARCAGLFIAGCCPMNAGPTGV